MALIKNAELWHARLVPNRPNKKFSRDNPTWEVQIRTYSADQRKQWESQGLKLKAVVPDDGGKPYWKTTLKKKIKKKDGSDSSPVEVKNGNLTDADPAIIGNGSVGDVRVYQYEYNGDNGPGTANILQGVKLKKLIKYTPKAFDDDFEEEEMEVVEPEDDEEDEEEEVAKPKTPSPKPKSKFD